MLQPIDQQYLQVGYIARSHGVNGKVLINSEVTAPELFDEIDLVHIQNTRGDLIPARIESVRAQQKGDRLSFFVKFEHVTDRNQAEELKGFVVFVDRSKAEHLWEDEALTDYTSFRVYDENERYIGKVTGMMETPAHLILEIVTENANQLLVPFVDEYVRSSDEESRVVVCQNLNQLIEEI